MLAYQQGHLTEIRDTIGCELVHILFFNDQSRELMMCADEKWFRIPCESGIEGWCIVTGETINLDDAYRDHRFNENMDRVTGVKTRNILCSPLRANRGGGRVVAVLNLINKKGGSNFDDNDEIIVHQMANNFIDEMAAEFGDLLSLNDSISSFATPILPSDGRRPSFSHEGHTTATSNYRNMVETTKKYLEERKGVESGFKIGSNDSQSQEKEKSKRERRRSFGEKLNQEIAENPELLHVRKN
ncbi:PDE10A [Symbiodinium microadriaticum]|nr:PDE10A [Symbiodinium microadriaticum]